MRTATDRKPPLTKEWISGIKKAWQAEADAPLSGKDASDCLEHLEALIRWVELLAEDLFFNMGFLLSSEYVGDDDMLTKLRQKVHDELLSVRDVLLKEHDYIVNLRDEFVTPTEGYHLHRGRIREFYQKQDPRSPERAFNQAVRDMTEAAIQKATEGLNRKLFRVLNETVNKWGPVDLGSRPLVYDLKGVKVIYEDLPALGKGVFDQFPKERKEQRSVNPEAYVRPLQEAADRLQRAGLGFLWYGVLRVRCKDCGGENPHGKHFGVGAHYLPNKDEIWIYADPAAWLAPLVIHEVGHRYYFRFMSQADRARFDSYFAGATARAVWEVLKRYAGVMSEEHAAVVGKFRADPGGLSNLSLLVRTYIDRMGDADRATVAGWERGVPATSEYGSASSAEDFAEVFRAYVMREDLSRDQIERFKAFLGRMQRSAKRVAALHREATASVPVTATVTLPYLRSLLTYMEAANEDEASEWRGSWTVVLPDIRRLAGRSLEDTALLWGGVPTVDEILSHMEYKGLPPELLRRVREDVPLPRAPRQPPTQDSVRSDMRAAVAEFEAVLPSRASLNVQHEYEATPGKVKALRAWVRVFSTVRTKYPAVWSVMERHLRKLHLEVRPTDSAEASWGGHLTLNLKEGFRPSAGVLIHEVGHMFEDEQPDGVEIAAQRGLYGNPPFSHNLFQDRPVEDFAECFRQYFTEPSLLRRMAPLKYADMNGRLG